MTEHSHESGAHEHDDDHGHEHDHPDGRLRRLAEVFVGHSHDPGDSIDDALTSDARGIRALKLSLLVLGITAVAQLAVVLVSGSVALLADTIHNFSDALTAIPLWIAFAIGGRAATRRYTFGYRRAEDLAGLFVLLMIAGLGPPRRLRVDQPAHRPAADHEHPDRPRRRPHRLRRQRGSSPSTASGSAARSARPRSSPTATTPGPTG